MTNGIDAAAEARPGIESQERPWSREDALALGILILSLIASLIWFVHPWFYQDNDASLYISSTRALISGEGYSYLGMPFLVRPPGFPLLLAPILRVAGTNFYALNLFVASFGCGLLVLLFCWVRPRMGWLLSLAICYAVGLNPVFLKLCNEVMSDVPGVFFILVSLLVARRGERNPSLGNEILLGICIAVSAYVRVLGLMMLPAILIDRAIRHAQQRRPNPSWGRFLGTRCLPLATTCFILLAPWGIRNQMSDVPLPYDQLLNYSYATGLFHRDAGVPDSPRIGASEWGERIVIRGGEITAALASRLKEKKPSGGHITIVILILGVYFFGLVTSPSASGFFILISLAVTGTYFAFQDRLLLPIFVLLVPVLSEALHRLIGRRLGPQRATGAVLLLWLAIIFSDFSPFHKWDRIEEKHHRLSEASSALMRELPADARLATGRGFHYAMMMDRPVYSLDWAHRHGPGLTGIDAVIDRYQINTVLLDPTRELDRSLEPELVGRYGEGKWIEGLRIIRVRP